MEIEAPFLVGSWFVEPMENRISNSDQKINLDPRLMDALVFLATHSGAVISKDSLMEGVWCGTIVSDNTLSQTVSRLRTALGDDWQNPTYIETVSKKGYRLIAPVQAVGDGVAGYQGGVDSLPPEMALAASSHAVKLTRESGTGFARAPIGFVLIGFALAIVFVLSILNSDHPELRIPIFDPQIASSMIGLEQNPRISPDGEMFAYMKSGDRTDELDIFLRRIGSTNERQLTSDPGPDAYPAWTPDGQSIVFVSAEGNNSCGIFEKPVLEGPRIYLGDCYSSPGRLDVHPITRDIVFSSSQNQGSPRRLFLLSRGDSQSIPLTSPPDNGSGDNDPVFSPDGSYIVFRRSLGNGNLELFRIPTTGGVATQLTTGNRSTIGHDFIPSVFLHGNARSFDQAGFAAFPELANTVGSGNAEAIDFDQLLQEDLIVYSSNRTGRRRLWLVSSQGGTPVPLPLGDRVPTEPSVASNAHRFTFRSNIDQTHLWKLSLIDKKARPVPFAQSTQAEMHPSISPDQQRVAFISNRLGAFDVWSADTSGSNMIRHTDLSGAWVSGPSWSNDGSTLLMDASIIYDSDLHEVNASGEVLSRIVVGTADEVNGRYSVNGHALYYSSDSSGTWQIWKRSLSSNVDNQVTFEGGYVAQENHDGTLLYYTKLGVPGLWRRSLVTDATTVKEEMIFEDLHPMDGASWVVGKSGIYFVARNPVGICFWDFSSKEIRYLIKTEKPIPAWTGPAITVAADESWLIYSMIEQREDEIKYVDF